MSWRDAWYQRLKQYLDTPRHGAVTNTRALLARVEALEGMVDILIRSDSELSFMSRRYNREQAKAKSDEG